MDESFKSLKKQANDEHKMAAMQTQVTQFSEDMKVRDVFDIGKEKIHVGEDEYTLKNTQKEAELIAFALSKDSKFVLSDEQKVRLRARQGRNLSHILINSKKFFGDSDEMIAVKHAVRKVEDTLRKERDTDAPMTAEEIGEVEKVYEDAIETCTAYLGVKTTYTRSDRYLMVKQRMSGLLDELAYISTIKEKMKAHPELGKVKSPYDLLVLSKMDQLMGKKEEAGQGSGTGGDAKEQQKNEEKKTSSVDADINKLEESAQQVAKILTLKAIPSQYSKKQGDDGANMGTFLYNVLKNFPKGAHVEYLHTAISGFKDNASVRKTKSGKTLKVNNTLMAIKQAEDGSMSLVVGEKTIPIQFDRQLILRQMENDMIDNEAKFSKQFTNENTAWVRKADPNGEMAPQVRAACLRLLRNRTGMLQSQFNLISTQELRSMTVNVMDGLMDAAEVEDYLKTIDFDQQATNALINGEDTMELLRRREQSKEELQQKVVFRQEQKKQEKKSDDDKKNELEWTEQETKVKELFADLIYSKDTWTADSTAEEPGVRLQKTLQAHSHTLAYLVRHPETISNMISRLPIPDGSEEEKKEPGYISPKERIDKAITDLINLDEVQALRKIPWSPEVNLWFTKIEEDKPLKMALNLAIGSEAVLKQLGNVENTINQMADTGMEQVQKAIDAATEALFGATEKKEYTENVKNPFEKGISDEEKQKRIDEGNSRLDSIIEESMKGASGQGLFTKKVLQSYFKGVSVLDKRSMLGAMIRDASPSAVHMLDMKDEDQMRKVAGQYLGGLFKGAGPLLQKMLQGLPISGFPKELRKALDDVKSNLMPIPDDIVESQFLAMVERSGGRVTKIEKVKSLGAASVGQAFLCKLYGPDIPAEGREVVVKLLRPDAKNRMEREKTVMKKAAAETSEGMLKTYEGQLERIEEELDLTIEARNVELGRIYDKSRNAKKENDGVTSMKLDKLIEPTTTSMVLEKSPGTTVDRYMKDIDASIIETLRPYMTFEMKDGEEVPVMDGEIPKLNLANITVEQKTNIKVALSKLFEPMRKRQKHLITLSEKWVEQGLFGEGFYHGDLHAGNIMIDDNGATVIDFGNATVLDEKQKSNITRMMVAAGIGDMDLFRHEFHELMQTDEKMERDYQKVRTQFGNMIKEIFSMGNSKSSGKRIAAILLKAQELGLKLPAAIFNFSQCQLRLQNTVDDMNKKIKNTQKIFEIIDESRSLETSDITEAASSLIKEHIEEKASIIYTLKLDSVPDSLEDFKEAIKGNSPEQIKEFEKYYRVEGFEQKGTFYEAYNNLAMTLNVMPAMTKDMAEDKNNKAALIENVKNCHKILEKVLKSKYLEEISKDLEASMENPYENQEKLKAVLEKLRDINYDKQYEDLRKAQKEGASEEELAKLEEKTHKAFLAFRSSIENQACNDAGADGIATNLALYMGDCYREKDREKMEKKLAPYFNDELHGAELRKEFDDMVKKLTDDPGDDSDYKHRDEIAKPFVKKLRLAIADKVEALKNVEFKEGVKNTEGKAPEDFIDVMGTVINDHIKKLLNRIGYVWSLTHYSKLKDFQEGKI